MGVKWHVHPRMLGQPCLDVNGDQAPFQLGGRWCSSEMTMPSATSRAENVTEPYFAATETGTPFMPVASLRTMNAKVIWVTGA